MDISKPDESNQKDFLICEIMKEYILMNRMYFQENKYVISMYIDSSEKDKWEKAHKYNSEIMMKLSDRIHNLPLHVGGTDLVSIKRELNVIGDLSEFLTLPPELNPIVFEGIIRLRRTIRTLNEFVNSERIEVDGNG